MCWAHGVKGRGACNCKTSYQAGFTGAKARRKGGKESCRFLGEQKEPPRARKGGSLGVHGASPVQEAPNTLGKIGSPQGFEKRNNVICSCCHAENNGKGGDTNYKATVVIYVTDDVGLDQRGGNGDKKGQTVSLGLQFLPLAHRWPNAQSLWTQRVHS